MSRIAADFARLFVWQTCPGGNLNCPRFKRKKEKPVKAATALSLASRALCNFVLLNPRAYAPGFIPPPTFVGSYQGGTPPFPGAPRGPSPTSWTLIIHGGSPPFQSAAPDPSPTSWTLIIHGGSPAFPVAPLARPSPISLDLIIMSVLLLSACRFGNPLVYFVIVVIA
jgi:hypothetical protein